MASNDAPDASDDGPYHHGLEAPKTFKKHHKNSCFCIAWSHDCEIIYSGGGDNTTRVWKADGTLLHTITDKRGGHASHTTCVSTRIAEDGEEELVTGSYDEIIRFWRKKGAVKVREEKNTWFTAWRPARAVSRRVRQQRRQDSDVRRRGRHAPRDAPRAQDGDPLDWLVA